MRKSKLGALAICFISLWIIQPAFAMELSAQQTQNIRDNLGKLLKTYIAFAEEASNKGLNTQEYYRLASTSPTVSQTFQDLEQQRNDTAIQLAKLQYPQPDESAIRVYQNMLLTGKQNYLEAIQSTVSVVRWFHTNSDDAFYEKYIDDLFLGIGIDKSFLEKRVQEVQKRDFDDKTLNDAKRFEKLFDLRATFEIKDPDYNNDELAKNKILILLSAGSMLKGPWWFSNGLVASTLISNIHEEIAYQNLFGAVASYENGDSKLSLSAKMDSLLLGMLSL